MLIFVQSGIYQNWRLKLASGILSIRGEIHFAQTFPTRPKINPTTTAVTKNDQVPIKTDFFEVTDYKLSFRNFKKVRLSRIRMLDPYFVNSHVFCKHLSSLQFLLKDVNDNFLIFP